MDTMNTAHPLVKSECTAGAWEIERQNHLSEVDSITWIKSLLIKN